MLEDSKPTPKVFRCNPRAKAKKPTKARKTENTPPPKQIIERADDRWMALVKGTKNQRIDVVEAWPNPVCHMTI